MEFRLLLRNGEQIVLALVDTLAGVARWCLRRRPARPRRAASAGDAHPGRDRAGHPVHVLHLARDRDRLRAPLRSARSSSASRHSRARGLLAGKVLSLLAVQVVQIAVICGRRGAARMAAGRSRRCRCSQRSVLWWAGCAAFAAWALFLAGTLRAEATLALANLVFVLLLVGGAVLVPAATVRPRGRRAPCAALRPRSPADCGTHSHSVGSTERQSWSCSRGRWWARSRPA